MVIELVPVPQAVLPISAFREYLRLGSGFADDALQDGVLESALRASLALVEQRAGVAVLSRGFRFSAGRWRDRAGQMLPLSPVSAVTSLRIIDGDGVASEVAAGGWRLVLDGRVARLEPLGMLPPVPRLGRLEIDLVAGFGASWEAVPADLAQAVFMQAARFYEQRSGGDGGLAAGVAALLESYRPVRAGLCGAVR